MHKINVKAALILITFVTAIFLIGLSEKIANQGNTPDPFLQIEDNLENNHNNFYPLPGEANTEPILQPETENEAPDQGNNTDGDQGDSSDNPSTPPNSPEQTKPLEEACPDPEDVEEIITEGISIIKNPHHQKIKLVNKTDGYSLSLPREMKLTDIGATNIRLVLEDQHRKLEIYKQPLVGINPSPQVYITYSNRFLSNTDDHRLELLKQRTIGAHPAEIRLWSRKKLAKVANDKNYYASVDLIAGKAVYTFFIKSDLPFDETNGYLDLVENFATFEPTATAADFKIRETANVSWNEETRSLYEKYFLSGGELTWGIFEPTAPYSFENLTQLEANLDYNFKFLLVYKSVQKTFPKGYVKNTLQGAYDQGKIVELTLQTVAQGPGEGNMVYDILDGAYDEFLTAFAKETVEFGHPVLFRFGNEMNGDWCVYSAYHTAKDTDVFVELYKYIYGIFEAEGADNVIWVWNPNEKSYPDYKWNNELLYYPGDEYVDLVGITGYNNGTYYQAIGETWRGFTEIYDPLYQRVAAILEKALIFSGFSSSSVGGNKEQWVRNMFANLYKYPKIKLAIWWNGCDWDQDGNIARPYFIDESEELLEIFKENLK